MASKSQAWSREVVRLNILQADVFTRADNIVLDEFAVRHADGRSIARQVQLEEMTFLLEGALSDTQRQV